MSTEVPPCGPLNAKIAFVGEAPGEHEVRTGIPFSGPSGHLLNQMLQSVGINRSECYFTNVMRIRPNGNDFSQFYLEPRRLNPSIVLQEGIRRLHNELESCSANIIVALGAEPLRALSGKRGIDKWRGSVLNCQIGETTTRKLCSTYHPAYVLRLYESRPVVELDLARARDESDFSGLKKPTIDFSIRPSFPAVLEYLNQRPKRIAFDLETTQSRVRCLALSSGKGQAICIPFVKNATAPQIGSSHLVFGGYGYKPEGLDWNYWREEEEYEILKALDKLFQDPSVEKVAQNAPFDISVLEKEFGFVFRGPILDTMLMHHCVYPELPKGLDFLASIYTKYPYYSDYDASVDDQVWTYNSYDAAVTFEVAEAVEKELAESNLLEFYQNHIQPTSLALTRAQNRGVLIDQVERTKQLEQVTAELKVLTTNLQQKAENPTFNPSSPKQVGQLLYGKLRLPTEFNHKTGQPTTGKDAMEALARKNPGQSSLFEMLQKHSSLDTVRTSFLSKQLKEDSRIYTSFNTAGTVTGRLSSGEGFWLPASTNLQNIRKPSNGNDRRCFRADEGFILVKADLSQAEFRIVVWLAKIERLIREYKENPRFDCHRWVGSLIYRVPEDKVTSAQRDLSKNGVYGGNYAMAPITAARTYKLPFTVAKFILEEYRRAIPEIPEWWKTVDARLLSTRTLVNPFGRRRVFFGRADPDMFRAGYSHSAQSIVADVINRALSLADEIFNPEEAQILLQVHDEIVVQVKKRFEAKYIKILKTLMEYPIQFEGVSEPLVIPADVKVGPNWLDVKEFKGEEQK